MEKIDLLKNEYLKLQDIYEDFDKRCHTIKNWSVVSALATIGLGIDKGKPPLLLLGSFVALIFWFLESTWKIFQYSNGKRIKEIENAFALNNFENIVPLQIYSSWFPEYRQIRKKYLQIAFQWFVMLPHAFAFIFGILLFLFRIV